MTQQYLSLLISLFVCVNRIQAGEGLKFNLTVSPLEWSSLQNTSESRDIVLDWGVTNITKQNIILPIFTPSNIEIFDDNNKLIFVDFGNDFGKSQPNPNDYLVLKPAISVFYNIGHFHLLNQNNELYLKGQGIGGRWYLIGPLHPGKYKIKVRFSTDEEPSDTEKKQLSANQFWLGQFTDIVNIIVK